LRFFCEAIESRVWLASNTRKHSDGTKITNAERFALAMSRIGGKRLTYADLTGKDADALHSSTTGTGQTTQA
jgi:hypothetical protein